MTDKLDLLRQIRELDDHITRLLESAKALQDKMRGIGNDCKACDGKGEVIISTTGVSLYAIKCGACEGTGKTHD